LLLKRVSVKYKKPSTTKKDFINGEFEDIEDDNDRKI